MPSSVIGPSESPRTRGAEPAAPHSRRGPVPSHLGASFWGTPQNGVGGLFGFPLTYPKKRHPQKIHPLFQVLYYVGSLNCCLYVFNEPGGNIEKGKCGHEAMERARC